VFNSSTSGSTATLAKCSDHKDTGGGDTATTSTETPDVITWNNGHTRSVIGTNTFITPGVYPAGQTEFECHARLHDGAGHDDSRVCPGIDG